MLGFTGTDEIFRTETIIHDYENILCYMLLCKNESTRPWTGSNCDLTVIDVWQYMCDDCGQGSELNIASIQRNNNGPALRPVNLPDKAVGMWIQLTPI